MPQGSARITPATLRLAKGVSDSRPDAVSNLFRNAARQRQDQTNRHERGCAGGSVEKGTAEERQAALSVVLITPWAALRQAHPRWASLALPQLLLDELLLRACLGLRLDAHDTAAPGLAQLVVPVIEVGLHRLHQLAEL